MILPIKYCKSNASIISITIKEKHSFFSFIELTWLFQNGARAEGYEVFTLPVTSYLWNVPKFHHCAVLSSLTL